MAKKDWMIIESELDEDQIKVLMATNDKSCLVSGCAGSGKSVLALIKAQRIQKEKGDNYQIIVYTKALCNYMNAGRETLGLHNDFYFHEEWRWKKALKRYANGQAFMVYLRDANGNKVPNMPKADYVIVDEIQDFTQTEIEEFIAATKKNFFFFGDTAQSIYEGLKDTMPVNGINRLFSYDNEPKISHFTEITACRFLQHVSLSMSVSTWKRMTSARIKARKLPSQSLSVTMT